MVDDVEITIRGAAGATVRAAFEELSSKSRAAAGGRGSGPTFPTGPRCTACSSACATSASRSSKFESPRSKRGLHIMDASQ